MSGLCSQQLKQLVSAQHITASHPVLKSWRQSSLQIMSWHQISRLPTLYGRLLTTMGRTFLRAVKSCQGRCSWRAGMKDLAGPAWACSRRFFSTAIFAFCSASRSAPAEP